MLKSPWRKDFPLLNNKDIVYLDNAATTQKPACVIQTINNYYTSQNANVHRGLHFLSEQATILFEQSRKCVSDFINAKSTNEIIYTKGTTEAINLVASSYANHLLTDKDEILITHMEHHANIVPWQIVCEKTGAKLKVLPINDNGTLSFKNIEKFLTCNTKLLAVTYVSNALGTINPIEKLIKLARANGTTILIDAAQAVSHIKIDVQKMDCDFLAFSGHKIYGPTGIGVLYGKEKLLDKMPPYQVGGEMIKEVRLEKSTYNRLPFKFEAGTPNISGAIGLRTAINYLDDIKLHSINNYENSLLEYARQKLSQLDNYTIIGNNYDKVGIFSLIHKTAHAQDISSILDLDGVAIRAGHHCTMPLMKYYNIPATARISLSLYNDQQDIEQLLLSLNKVNKLFKE